jgi:serine protease Do
MRFSKILMIGLIFCSSIVGTNLDCLRAFAEDDPRMTPMVQAVQQCRKSVVNLRGRKTVPDTSDRADSNKIKQVNGMGTGVVIDSRGYVLTNYHVVQGVKEIEVTTYDGLKTTGVLLAHDPDTDLAIIKINTNQPLPKIRIGSSSDLMLAETVIAIGNAYGYEHTVTEGIVSQLGRTVQVTDQQVYRDLIQISASINPGNSGGPLLNLKGEMIGVNVAVRIGAQGIAFAIPVNHAMEVAAKLMSQLVPQDVHHGVVARTVFVDHQPQVVIQKVDAESPAEKAGLLAGDRILEVNGTPVSFEAEFQSCLINTKVSEQVCMRILQQDREKEVAVAIETRLPSELDQTWNILGVRVVPVSEQELASRDKDYKSGLRVIQIRPNSPAAKGGLKVDDVFVAMHDYRIESIDNLKYVLSHPDLSKKDRLVFYILRDQVPFKGEMRLAQGASSIIK